MEHYNNELKKLLTLMTFCLGFSASITMFFPSVVMIHEGIKYQIVGAYAIFGSKISFVYHFNIVPLIAYLFVLIGVILSVIQFKKENKWMYIICATLFLVAGVMFLFTTKSFAFVNQGEAYIQEASEIRNGSGVYFGSILSFLSSFLMLGAFFYKPRS